MGLLNHTWSFYVHLWCYFNRWSTDEKNLQQTIHHVTLDTPLLILTLFCCDKWFLSISSNQQKYVVVFFQIQTHSYKREIAIITKFWGTLRPFLTKKNPKQIKLTPVDAHFQQFLFSVSCKEAICMQNSFDLGEWQLEGPLPIIPLKRN